MLLTKGRVGGEDAFEEATALFGVGAVAGLATEDSVAHGALGGVIRRLNALDVEEGPECVDALEQLRAGPGGLEIGHGGALGEQRLDAALDRAHVDAEAGARERAVAYPMPPSKHPLGFRE